jgi:hypothetical protein
LNKQPRGVRLSAAQEDELRRRIGAGEKPHAAARAMGVGERSARRIARKMLAQAAEKPPEVQRREQHDSAFYRRRSLSLARDLAKVELLAEQLAGMRGQPVQPPAWLLAPSSGKRSRSVIGLLLSDVHAGEVVSADEILGLNSFDIEICRRRLRRLFAAACEIGPRWIVDCANQGVLLTLGGDLVSGDIHEELRITNGLTAHEQVRFVVEEVTAGIRHLRETFGRVHVVSVPGNHGRVTVKPTAKLYARASYDTLAASMIADRFEGDKRVTFQIGASRDAVVPVLGHTVFVNHGDGMGTGGGQGFIGPLAPIVRGTKKVEAQQARAGRRPDLILHGHYHTSANPGNVLSNGSVPGYTEYGNGLRASLEPPMQWLFLLHERWKLRERVEIQLEEPAIPPLPRVRIPAEMGRA